MALRPYWSGQIRLSLVSLPVNIYPALSRSRQIPLYEIYRKTGQRVAFYLDKEKKDNEGDTIAWTFKPINNTLPYKVVIFND